MNLLSQLRTLLYKCYSTTGAYTTRSVDQLEKHAVMFWPEFLTERERELSILPRLLDSQEKFIGLLYMADASPTSWKEILAATAEMPANLFLKHLIVVADQGGEKLKRYRTRLSKFFPSGALRFTWREKLYRHEFKSIDSATTWANAFLHIDGKEFAKPVPLNSAMEDVAMLILHGGSAVDATLPNDLTENCVVGGLIGRKRELDAFVRQRYIQVSQIIRGARANAMGHPCQLPPALMMRLIELFTKKGELVLDPFNGAGTTTLCAQILERRFIGIELSQNYHELTLSRHRLLDQGGDPFGKASAVPKVKNSRVKRIGGIKYKVSKKQLQLDVRRIARILGRLPSRDEVEEHSEYPLSFFDEYFLSWGEVCAAARTTGMNETRRKQTAKPRVDQRLLFSLE